jgi:hypothetical protein
MIGAVLLQMVLSVFSYGPCDGGPADCGTPIVAPLVAMVQNLSSK